MATTHKVGGEIDASCTSCKRDTVHRIVALFEGKPKKVECLSCKKTHLYRPSEEAKQAAAAHKRASKTDLSSTPQRPKPSSRVDRSGASSKRREDEDAALWEKAIAGKPNDDFKRYRLDSTFARGELIKHTKFGDGIVFDTDGNRVVVLFKEGRKTLAQGLATA